MGRPSPPVFIHWGAGRPARWLLNQRARTRRLNGLLAKRQLLTYAAVTGALALVCGLALPTFLRRILPLFRQPKPAEKPVDFPDVWPSYFVAAAFFPQPAVWSVVPAWVDRKRGARAADGYSTRGIAAF